MTYSKQATGVFKAGELGEHYKRLCADRRPFVERAQTAARLTLPALFPEDGHNPHASFEDPFQSTGGEGVLNLSSKLMLALFPASSSFFRLRVDETALDAEDAATLSQDGVKQEIEASLAALELRSMELFETLAWRPQLHQAIKSLIVTGNALLLEDENKLRVFHLGQYVVERDGLGEPLTIITCEKLGFGTLTEEQQAKVLQANPGVNALPDTPVTLYTAAFLNSKDKWEMVQELGGVEVYRKTRKAEDLPFIVLTWHRIDGEDYGRGRVEEVIGTLHALEQFAESSVKIAAHAARVIPMNGVRSGVTDRRLANIRDGEVLGGVTDLDQIRYLQVDKSNDLQLMLNRMEALERQAQRAFLDFEAVRRNAERVTAEEIRTIALELEENLGGIYAVLTQTLQIPLVMQLLRKLRMADGSIPDMVKPTIIAGLDALGRGQDFQRVVVFTQNVVSAFGPEAMQYLNMPWLLRKAAISSGLDAEQAIKSPGQVAQEQQQAMLQQGAMQAVGPAAQAIARNASGQVNNG